MYYGSWPVPCSVMMTSSNGNLFCVIGPLCGEFTGHRSIGHWRGALMFHLICAWINGWANNREPGDLRPHRAHYNVIVMVSCLFQWISETIYFMCRVRRTKSYWSCYTAKSLSILASLSVNMSFESIFALRLSTIMENVFYILPLITWWDYCKIRASGSVFHVGNRAIFYHLHFHCCVNFGYLYIFGRSDMWHDCIVHSKNREKYRN